MEAVWVKIGELRAIEQARVKKSALEEEAIVQERGQTGFV